MSPENQKEHNEKKKKLRLGEYLVKEGLISKNNLIEALEKQKLTGEPLGEILVKNHLIEEKQLYKILAVQLEVDFLDLFQIKIPKELISLIQEHTAKIYCLIPVKKEGNVLTIAMANPTDTFAIDEVRTSTGLTIKPVISSRSQILDTIDQHYTGGVVGEALKLVGGREIEERAEAYDDTEDIDKIRQIAEEAPIIKLVNAIIYDSVGTNASDVHIEPTLKDCRVRYRVDGILHDFSNLPRQYFRAVISRVKIMANMDIAERRLPQDGSFRLELEDKHIDIRVSTYPTINGEKIVMRLLVREQTFFTLTELGFESEQLSSFESLIKKPWGNILVVGPTGCGKTTTLYSALTRINSKEKNIITIEDPIEYEIKGICQSQINPKAGFTFANSLRSMMRQNPDIILVGEIRDLETAELAIRAALTGHLVFSTLHTNDSLGAITRLIDMGIEPYLVSASVIGILAQRLVRKVCPYCKEEIKLPPAVLETFTAEIGPLENIEYKFYRGKGCDYCKNTGYKGRTALFELLQITGDEMRNMITYNNQVSALRKVALEHGFHTLKQSGLKKVLRGITTLEEVLQVTG